MTLVVETHEDGAFGSTTERNFRTNLERLRSGTATTATVAAIERDITTASRRQVEWALRRLMALRALGLYLMTTPRRGRGRPKKGQRGLFQSLTDRSLRDLGITDNHIATRALNVARISDEIYNAYLASTDEPTEAGLLRYSENYSSSDRRGHPWYFPSAHGKLASHGSSVEYYTNEYVFEALGCTFDLDPASPGKDVVPWIPAKRHYTIVEDGLTQDWGDAFVFLNFPYTKDGTPLWAEKFRKHGNGVALCVDRTSTGWWQELCGNADLILQVNKKINFVRPDGETANNALGSTLVAYGKRGVEALMNAACAGLGTLFQRVKPEKTRVENYSSEPKKQFWLTSPARLAAVQQEFGEFWDACPQERSPGFDALEIDWPDDRPIYVNEIFSATNDPDGHGPTDWARKAIAEHQRGKGPIIFVAPILSHIDLLLRAGAEPRTWGREPFLDLQTREPHPSPPFKGCFILHKYEKT